MRRKASNSDQYPEKSADSTNGDSVQSDQGKNVTGAFQQHQAALRRFISRFVRRHHDIDDVAQETFLRAYRAEQSRDEAIEQPKSFLFRIAHNVAISELTRKSNQMTDCLADIDESGVIWEAESVEADLMARQLIGIHCEAVAILPAQCRRVYLMRKVHGMPHREIASHLNIALSTVEKHISKGSRECSQYVQLREEGLDAAAAQEALNQARTQANSRANAAAKNRSNQRGAYHG